MIDTIVLVLKQSMFVIIDHDRFEPSTRSLYGDASMGSRGYATYKQNPTPTELKNGIYKPRLTVTRRFNDGVLERTMKIEFSAPKLLYKNNFVEIETPIMVKPTPEGARDYIVPSRVNPGKFYALPQSPQLYKQILMVSGFDKYFQIARCMRDEDLRADRQPEHTQIDLEMSFVSSKDIMEFVEGMYKHLFHEILGIKLDDFKAITYEESMKKYGTDKPDMRKDKNNPNEFAYFEQKDPSLPLLQK